MAWRIGWVNPAWDDLDSAAEYISRDSPRYAAAFTREVLKSVSSLRQFPRHGRIVPEFDDPSLRELIVQSYRLIYRIRGNKITILGLIHGARDLPRLWKRERRDEN